MVPVILYSKSPAFTLLKQRIYPLFISKVSSPTRTDAELTPNKKGTLDTTQPPLVRLNGGRVLEQTKFRYHMIEILYPYLARTSKV